MISVNISKILKSTDTTIRNYLRKLKIPLFHRSSIKQKNLWLSSHNKENFYVE
jgi:hypothetical protein